MPVEVMENEQQIREALKGNVVVDFFATWCGPCKMLAPVLEEVAEQKDVRIIKVDVDQVPQIGADYGIMSVPTVLKISEGQVIEKVIGFVPADALIEKLGL